MEIFFIFLFVHALFGGLALISGLLGIFLRRREVFEKVFLVCSFISVFASLGVIGRIESGLIVQVAFGTLAFFWIFFLVMLMLSILKGRREEGRKWFLRAFALVLFFVTVRLWRAGLVFIGTEYDAAYGVAAWLGWTLNLLFVEYVVLKR